jgi:serine kinase of HPr protein (carbohydrate metabolism regulator)
MERVKGTCVAVDGQGVLLCGRSGVGKSDLALRLIDNGAALVADDYTEIEVRHGHLFAAAPQTIRGLLEVRGLGVLHFDSVQPVKLTVAIELVPPDEVPRMPDPEIMRILGVALPLFRLSAFETSAEVKVRLAVRLVTGSIMSVS